MCHAGDKIFHVWSIPPLAAVATNRNLKEKRMTNVFRQLLMSTYDVHALLEAEAVCCNGYLRQIWIRGEPSIDVVGEDHVD